MAQTVDDKKANVVIAPDQTEEVIEGFPEKLPLLPLRDVVLFPYMVIPILVVRDASVGALQWPRVSIVPRTGPTRSTSRTHSGTAFDPKSSAVESRVVDRAALGVFSPAPAIPYLLPG